MLKVEEIKPNVFCITETILGWIRNHVSQWYWDLDKKLISEKEDFPEGMFTRTLTEEQLNRFETVYRKLIK